MNIISNQNELRKLEYILNNIIPKNKKQKIFRILKTKNCIKRISSIHWEVCSRTLSEKKYNVTWYSARNKFICDCEGYSNTIAMMRNRIDVDQKDKRFFENNFKCIHIYALISYLLMKK